VDSVVGNFIASCAIATAMASPMKPRRTKATAMK
jgi:hypothetical protein